ncbi:hypothetical protein B0T21DRAFT_250990, partial [Apiosordaria backusii]
MIESRIRTPCANRMIQDKCNFSSPNSLRTLLSHHSLFSGLPACRGFKAIVPSFCGLLSRT